MIINSNIRLIVKLHFMTLFTGVPINYFTSASLANITYIDQNYVIVFLIINY